MPDTLETFPDTTANNADVKAKLEGQGFDTPGVKPIDLQESGSALDALAKTVVEEKEILPDPAKPGESGNSSGEGDPGSAETPDPAVEAAAKKAAEEAAARAETLKKSDEYFKDSPSLPAGASPKSSESFAAIKIKATQEITARETQLAEARRELEELKAKAQEGPSPELLKELEDHRQWRARLDVDADPKFKQFDQQISSSQEFIYAQLRKSPVITADTIEQIKKHGGPENVNLEKIFAAVKDPQLQRIVEAKVADIEMAKFNKDQAISETKKNIEKYVADQRKAFEENSGAHNKATEQHFSQLAGKLTWFVEKPVDAKADEPTRKAAEEHNAFIRETKASLSAALKDDTAEMRAIMLTGMAQLLYLQRLRTAEQSVLASTKKALEEANAKLEKFTKASVSRLRETGAAPGGQNQIKNKPLDLTGNSASALDEIAKQVVEERARKANA